ncbi:hypothetical protein BD410DRAFT_733806, partial [Rickenella mellea]
VEDCLFKLPRESFEQSETFRGMFALPPTDVEEGTSDANPIRLEGVKSCDFVAFLKVLIPMAKEGATETLSLHEWLAALELAHKWEFKNTRQRAIEAIDELPMREVEKIQIIQKYGINEWTCPTYEKLLLREHPLTAHEMKSLGYEFSSKMAAARERLVVASHNKNGWRCYSELLCRICRRTINPPDSCPCGHSLRSCIPTSPVIREIFGDPVVIL